MSEARFDRIETELKAFGAGQVRLEGGVQEVRAGLQEVREELTHVRGDVDELHSGLQEVREELTHVRGDVDELRGGLQEVRGELQEVRGGLQGVREEVREVERSLRVHMGVLHEELLDRIKAIPDPRPYIDRRIDDGLQAIRAEFEPRLRNVEMAVRKRKRA